MEVGRKLTILRSHRWGFFLVVMRSKSGGISTYALSALRSVSEDAYMEIVASGYRLESQIRARFNRTVHWFTFAKKQSPSGSFVYLAKWSILVFKRLHRPLKWEFNWNKWKARKSPMNFRMKRIQTGKQLRMKGGAKGKVCKIKLFTSSKTRRYHNSFTVRKTTASRSNRLQRLSGEISPTLKLT